MSLEIKNLHVSVEKKPLLEDVSFTVKKGEVLVIVGPNGAGKSSLAHILLGNPKYVVDKGTIVLNGKNITSASPNERAQQGLFMSFQHPVEISGVTMANFLRTSYNLIHNTKLNTVQFHKLLKEKMEELHMDSSFRTRFVNSGFSGGEKKRSELLQLALFEPAFAILDEIDSGLDVDAMKHVGTVIQNIQKQNKTGFVIITHRSELLNYVEPTHVLVLKKGRIEKQGGKELIAEIEEKGFE